MTGTSRERHLAFSLILTTVCTLVLGLFLLADLGIGWEAGALMGAMIDYWHYTGDDTWNKVVTQGLLHQVGKFNDYMPDNQTLTEGNDDQGFWGLSVMSAAEYNFPNPPADQPQWLALAQAVFNTQAARWDPGHCNGGLRWQIFTWNNGFDYKNTISQACFFALASRLALYTGNSSYAEWADRTWDWMVGVKFITDDYYVYDGGNIQHNCTDIVPYQWTYNAGGMVLGAAAMYNFTGSQVWKNRLDGLVKATDVFFVGPESNIMQEVACETVNLCNLDQQSFKAYLSRWLAAITQWAPHLHDRVMSKLRPSSIAAAAQCKGGANGRMCGLKWTENGTWDGMQGVGQQMAALEVTLGNLVKDSRQPVTASGGGTSVGDPGAGGSDIGRNVPAVADYAPLGPGATAGAAILTLIVLGLLIAGMIWIFLDETSEKSLPERFFDFRSALLGGGAVAALATRRSKDDLNEKGKGVDHDASSDGASSQGNGVTSPLPMKGEVVTSEKGVPQRASAISQATGTTTVLGIPMVREKRLSKKAKHPELRNSVASEQSARIE
ncbi:Mannan endo-1,6-alpha-mannosidase DCW1-like protein 1 [Colletotrichum truncatum]|uniref:Mannan endo-1,6-alpha-mannosidase DCW1-like protein 1 n=1 Tax=Colletotrichum truncatum TaxID=5467 RepID=A0ACC3YZY1_COLTU|nr:Mannan endo-1,6-alpha-mannosidase DCW1-like protein 1 [Colletotrichum truncatum]KAF6800844.1 Mannan endo-1,6-alpha-mannosidase DCW1-like protein 1 [Colletotrichum truncatum]